MDALRRRKVNVIFLLYPKPVACRGLLRKQGQQPHQVQWLTMSTASSPVPMLRPAVLNCSLL